MKIAITIWKSYYYGDWSAEREVTSMQLVSIWLFVSYAGCAKTRSQVGYTDCHNCSSHHCDTDFFSGFSHQYCFGLSFSATLTAYTHLWPRFWKRWLHIGYTHYQLSKNAKFNANMRTYFNTRKQLPLKIVLRRKLVLLDKYLLESGDIVLLVE